MTPTLCRNPLCRRPLRSDASKALGYGPVCAERLGVRAKAESARATTPRVPRARRGAPKKWAQLEMWNESALAPIDSVTRVDSAALGAKSAEGSGA